MKRVLILGVLTLVSITTVLAQEQNARKGSYLTISAQTGSSSIKYDLKGLKDEKGNRSSKLGYGFDLKYNYFFDSHWGVATGVGLSHYQSTGKLKGAMNDETYYSLGKGFTDFDEEGRPRTFELRTRVTNLEEKQTTWLLDVPVMFMYQTRFGDEEKWGMYGGLGVKFQFPVTSKFKIQKGSASEFNVSGYYEGIPTDMGSPSEPPVPQHGYGTITNPNETLDWDNDIKFKMGIAGTAELGVMVDIGNDMDLLLGGYIDYGFNDIKKKGNRQLFTAPANYHPESYVNNTPYIGKGITYNGMLNSDATDKIKLISFGVKLGLRFKL